MHRIHFENRSIDICTPRDPTINDPEALIISNSSTSELSSLPDFFAGRKDFGRIVIPAEDEDAVFNTLCSQFKEIDAGGGVVRNDRGEYLLILRNGLWDLPKGKLEDGEHISECAIREVNEETGLDNLELGELICITHHTYHAFGEFCLKHTYWYDMRYHSDRTPTPQQEENISRAIWVSRDMLKRYVEGTYNSIKEVFVQKGLMV